MPYSSALALRYAAFAALATTVNVATQYATSMLYGGRYELYAAMAAGTFTGLVTKYHLDRRWIFDDRTTSLRGHSVKFTLYSLMGVFTTLLFWGTEIAFEMLGDAHWMRYAGAIVGLTIGYVVKYYLDRRFVFTGAAT